MPVVAGRQIAMRVCAQKGSEAGRQKEGEGGREREGEGKRQATETAPVDGLNALAGNGVLNKYQLTALTSASVVNVNPYV